MNVPRFSAIVRAQAFFYPQMAQIIADFFSREDAPPRRFFIRRWRRLPQI
jgi:hypothetical protein